jgi:RNA polymerase-binding transcription factor DksA
MAKKVDDQDKTGTGMTGTVISGTKLSATDLDGYKRLLLALRARIRGDVTAMTDAALSQSRSEAAGDLSVMPLHMADIGSDNFEQEQTLAFIQSDNATLGLIEEALERIKEGTYGICESCGKPIPKVRLNVLPYTANCVQCVEIASRD